MRFKKIAVILGVFDVFVFDDLYGGGYQFIIRFSLFPSRVFIFFDGIIFLLVGLSKASDIRIILTSKTEHIAVAHQATIAEVKLRLEMKVDVLGFQYSIISGF